MSPCFSHSLSKWNWSRSTELARWGSWKHKKKGEKKKRKKEKRKRIKPEENNKDNTRQVRREVQWQLQWGIDPAGRDIFIMVSAIADICWKQRSVDSLPPPEQFSLCFSRRQPFSPRHGVQAQVWLGLSSLSEWKLPLEAESWQLIGNRHFVPHGLLSASPLSSACCTGCSLWKTGGRRWTALSFIESEWSRWSDKDGAKHQKQKVLVIPHIHPCLKGLSCYCFLALSRRLGFF